MSQANLNRRQPRWAVLLIGTPLLPALGGALVGLMLTAFTVLEQRFCGPGTASLLDLPSTALVMTTYSTLIGVILGAPLVSILLLIGHFFTQRRPIDGLWIGIIGGTVLATVFVLGIDLDLIWFSLAIVPVGAFLGFALCRFGYR